MEVMRRPIEGLYGEPMYFKFSVRNEETGEEIVSGRNNENIF